VTLLMSIRDVAKAFGPQSVIKRIDINIRVGEVIGLVGKNGAGKTTLANIISGSLRPDKGIIEPHRRELKVGYLRQSTSYTVNTFTELVNSATPEAIHGFQEAARQLGLERVSTWEEDRLAGLSGGERTKLALAKVWSLRPDLLILDEPTNHLDFAGVEWLAQQLKGFDGAILVISHDRYFLDLVVDRIVELEEGEANHYAGNYSFYREEKRRRHEQQLHQYEVEMKRQARIETEIKRLDGWSSKAHDEARKAAIETGNVKGGKEHNRAKAKKMDRQVKSKRKRLEKLRFEAARRPTDEPEIRLDFVESGDRGRRILEARAIAKAFEGRSLFQGSSFYVQRGDRVGLVGPNGCGKTTLLRAIVGREALDSGELWVSPSLKTAYLSQDVMDLDEALTPLEMLDIARDAGARGMLVNMGFDNEMLHRQIGTLSLGERTKLKLAQLVLQQTDCLILDEPTNHLDLYSREELEESLEGFRGTLLLVSHDRYMLERLCNRLLVFEDGQVRSFEGGFAEYSDRGRRVGAEGTGEVVADNDDAQLAAIETRMAELVVRLGRLTPEDPEYLALDEEYGELAVRKRQLRIER